MKLLIVAVLLACAGCVRIHGTRDQPLTETRVVERQGAETVRAEITMGAGRLEIRGGAKALMEADFRFAPESWRPEVDYSVSGFRGRLAVRHPRQTVTMGPSVAEWKLRLNEDTQLDMHVRMGAGESRLDLGSLTLRNLEMEFGAGSLKLDLTGKPKKTMDIRIRGGVGEAEIRLPREAGVEVEAQGGIGEITARGMHKHGNIYRNDEAESGGVAMRVDVKGGVGAIRLIVE